MKLTCQFRRFLARTFRPVTPDPRNRKTASTPDPRASGREVKRVGTTIEVANECGYRIGKLNNTYSVISVKLN